MARETDRKKFIELAEKRVSKTLKDIKLIGNLSNKSNYSYTANLLIKHVPLPTFMTKGGGGGDFLGWWKNREEAENKLNYFR